MSNPTTEEIRPDLSALQTAFADAILKVKEFRGETFVCVTKESLVKIATFLRDDPALRFDYFVECVGVDYSTWEHERDLSERFEVVYNLYSLTLNQRLFLKVGVDDGQVVPTLRHVWMGAEYPEREINDLFGVQFQDNVHAGRFLLPDDWIGFPLRKEYPLGGEDVLFDGGTRGPAIEDTMMPHAGESFEGKTGSEEISGR